jgi:hypothetical protein
MSWIFTNRTTCPPQHDFFFFWHQPSNNHTQASTPPILNLHHEDDHSEDHHHNHNHQDSEADRKLAIGLTFATYILLMTLSLIICFGLPVLVVYLLGQRPLKNLLLGSSRGIDYSGGKELRNKEGDAVLFDACKCLGVYLKIFVKVRPCIRDG